ncbi:hypothetical protein [Cellulomonas sp. ES6]|uniref:hypothetical protein n=1 Tax=Cellulomonas sp. ES6 TaxID=3039384 RepID=UPI0024B7C186|nr:hypothetical protein [Cellulomonas sp. ES6]WHP18850.1 hypothetical protein P9841_06955 [Cellulomonas sp. ES6]
MKHLATTNAATSLGDYGASLLRTAVPAAWGTALAALLSWLLPRVPGDVGDALASLLRSDVVTSVLVAAAIAAWYAVARWIEPHLPDWLTRLVLGSAAAPEYAKVTADGAAVITDLPEVAWSLPSGDDDPKHAA